MRNLVLLIGAFTLSLLTGCVASGPVGYRKLDTQAKQSALYVFRPSKFAASGIKADITLDGKIVGEIPNGSYLAAFASPGHHIIEAKFSTLNSLWYRDAKLEVDLPVDARKYVLFDITMTSLTVIAGAGTGSSWSTGLSEVDEEQAIEVIQNLRINNEPDNSGNK